MRERAQAVGATLSIASQPGHGAEITIRWTRAPAEEA
jgi:signal transduction histidine kinase